VVNLQDRDSYWKMMHKYIGSDVTSLVTLPVIIFEPMTMLQKMAELCTMFRIRLLEIYTAHLQLKDVSAIFDPCRL
jgi:hypothetical protein